MDDLRVLAAAYVAQQREMGMPDIICGPGASATALLRAFDKSDSGRPQPASPSPQKKSPAGPVQQKTSSPRLLPVSHLIGARKKTFPSPAAPAAENDPVRQALAELFHATKNCMECGLGKTRTKFVFGTGNPRARLMIVGEAPGRDEDLQGLPFVGAAGELLTKMLAAIDLDRKKHVFIANVLKCRPPDNRTPESSEILACGRILSGQIDIIKPTALLLMGRTAAQALLNTSESLGALRGKQHFVAGIPAFVTYHPAALLHNPANKTPAWEDLKKLKIIFSELGVYAASENERTVYNR
ncbi:MAG TPA: uracil-DNA glycosylase [Chitinivibrionales bacterium]|nr:uracil-DNA glycosylase [Chitinivibrionales bacterium]